MHRCLPSLLVSVVGWACSWGLACGSEIDFSRDIQPLLAKRCYACHGPAEQESGLALHDRSMATAELESGQTAIISGKPAASELIRRISTSDEATRMPPEGAPLSPGEIQLLSDWIASGAEYSPHWSFVKPRRPAIPEIRNPQLAGNPIDNFVIARLDAIDLRPARPASPSKLIRRLYLDLIGLLPPVDQVAAFEGGQQSYTEVVDQLLASKHFGERWGRHWLDLARYADTFGYERDDVRPNAWRYRDWVVDSINRNQPYDQFIVDQLAGDLAENPTQDQRIAVGLHRMNIKNNESGINKEDYRNRETVDRVNTTSTAMLGLTLGCCQCHDHKYDPFSQAEYYSLYAFFNNLEPQDADIKGTAREQSRYAQAKADLDAHRAKLDDQKKLVSEMRKHESAFDWQGSDVKKTAAAIERLGLSGGLAAALRNQQLQLEIVNEFWQSLPGREDDIDQAKRQLSVQQRHLPKPYIMTLQERAEQRRSTHLLVRGDFKQPGDQVDPGTPKILPPFSSRSDRPDRLDLARWLVTPEHPLTARVAVNHIWAHLFGRGIVNTLDDFGTQGQPPTHPDLLDWLAVELIESGWDRKQLIRTMVLSDTYRQSSRVRRSDIASHQHAFAPDNPLFARQSRFRVEAEVLRDIYLDAAGLLSTQLGGPTVHPVIPAAVSDLGYKYKTRWIVSDRPQRYRRGMYIHFKRTNPYPTLLMFDGPESNVCQAMRNRSNTPLQALATLNDPAFMECAQALGLQLSRIDASDDDRLRHLAMRTVARPFADREQQSLTKLLEAERSWYGGKSDQAVALCGEYADEAVGVSEIAAWICVARSVLNLDEFVCRE